jgi:NAD(P)-dependent dehydrogenase (short-subunit alcohol dehydrogenase family)
VNPKGASIVVTGGARGIGLAIASRLIAEDANVTIAARSAESLAEAADRLHGTDRVATVASDVSTAAGCRAVADAAVRHFGGIDALVANAGLYAPTPIETTSEAEWDRVINTNLKSAFFCIQASLPELRRSSGAVVTLSSYYGTTGISGGVIAYGAAKAALINMTRALALDLAPDVRVNAIAPGYVETEKLLAMPDAPSFVEQLARDTPAGRLVQRDEVVEAVLFSLRSEIMTGAVISVDGGLSAGR